MVLDENDKPYRPGKRARELMTPLRPPARRVKLARPVEPKRINRATRVTNETRRSWQRDDDFEHRIGKVDKRTRMGRRIGEWEASFRKRLGAAVDDDLMTASSCKRAAELTTIAEDLRTRAIRGEAVSVETILRAERLASEAVRALNLDKPKGPPPPKRDPLREYLDRQREAPS